MQYSVGRDFKINLGGGTYENIGVSAHWTINHRDLGYTDQQWADHIDAVGPMAASKELTGIAHALMERELRSAFEEHEPYIIEPEESFLPLWLDEHPEPAPPKKKRGS